MEINNEHIVWYRNKNYFTYFLPNRKLHRLKIKKKNLNEIKHQEESYDEKICFHLNDPCSSDYHGIYALLSRVLIGTDLHLNALTDQIIRKSDASSVLFQENGDDTVFGLICAVSLKIHKTDSEQWISFISKFMIWIKEIFKGKSIQTILDLNSCALIFNERFVNLPTDVGALMFRSLNKCYSKEKEHFGSALKPFNPEDRSSFSVFEECGPVVHGDWSDKDESNNPFRSIHIIKRDKLFKAIDSILTKY